MRTSMQCRRRIAGLIACVVALAVASAAAADSPRWADQAKTIRVTFPIAETGFDPQASQDYYSSHVERAIFDTLYTFDYLQRPYKFVPNVAAAMPEISEDGRTYTIRIKPGIYFDDDPAFKGKKRELVAEDFVYAWKRLLDPRMRAPFLWYIEGKVAGADAVLAKANETGRLDYDAPIDGLKAIDRYTLRLVLKEPDYVMLGYMTQQPMAAVALSSVPRITQTFEPVVVL